MIFLKFLKFWYFAVILLQCCHDNHLSSVDELQTEIFAEDDKLCSLEDPPDYSLHSSLGSEIDRHSCVFRLGMAPIQGFEKHVGTKTFARIVNSNLIPRLMKKSQKYFSGPMYSKLWVFINADENIRRQLRQLKDRILNSTFIWMHYLKASKKFKTALERLGIDAGNKQPSELFHALLAINPSTCEHVNIFGVPGPDVCKNPETFQFKTLYWDISSAAQCDDNEIDAGDIQPGTMACGAVPAVIEREALRSIIMWDSKRSHSLCPSWNPCLFPLQPALCQEGKVKQRLQTDKYLWLRSESQRADFDKLTTRICISQPVCDEDSAE